MVGWRPEIEVLEQIARESGQFILGGSAEVKMEKTNTKDYATVADIKSQNLIKQRLNEHFPQDIVLGEEDPKDDLKRLFEPEFTGFVIDPIDGTFAFRHDMNESSVSIGHVTNGEPDHGVVYDPFRDEMFVAEKGKGAYLNGEPIHVSDRVALEGPFVTTGNSYEDEAMARNLRRQLAIYEQGGSMPWMALPGSGILAMAYVACGRIDIYHHNGVKPWDNVVAFLLVREAGGVVHDLHGNEARFITNMPLLGPEVLVAELEKIFARIDPELLC